MGIPPDNKDYEDGNDCTHCGADLFDGVTPKYIEVHVEGVNVCPGFPANNVNGVKLLTQHTIACDYRLFVAPNFYQIVFSAANTHFHIIATGVWLFIGNTLSKCNTLVINDNVCGLPNNGAAGGTAEFFWGPSIGP